VEVEGAVVLEVEGACWWWRWGSTEWRKKGHRIRERDREGARASYAREREQRMPSGGSVPSCKIEREREISLSEEAQIDWTVEMDSLGLQSDRLDFHVSDPGERAKAVWHVGESSQLKGLCSFPWSNDVWP
jgi:hypothetical protein